jgi:hypothetical protein
MITPGALWAGNLYCTENKRILFERQRAVQQGEQPIRRQRREY